MNARRWIKMLATAFAVIVAVTLMSGASYEVAMRRRTLREFPVRGRLVDIGGRKLQLDCRGTGSPTVVLESGLDVYGSLAWASVHDSLAATTRTCAYSRAGVMWSEAAPGPFDSKSVVRDLHTALHAAGENGPLVMVGHSLGASYLTVFAEQYGPEVAGIVLVDPSHPDQFARFREITGKSLEPSSGLVRFGAAMAWSGVVRLMPADSMPSSPSEISRVAPAFLSTSVSALARELDAVPASLRAAGELRSFGDRPVVVLSAGKRTSPEGARALGLTLEQDEQRAVMTRALHQDQASWSTRGRLQVVPDASHYVQFDRPDVVIAAIRDVARSVRQAPPQF